MSGFKIRLLLKSISPPARQGNKKPFVKTAAPQA